MIAEELGEKKKKIGGCSMGKRDRDKKREHEGKITAKEKKGHIFSRRTDLENGEVNGGRWVGRGEAKLRRGRRGDEMLFFERVMVV